jgi:asparagine synthase (glutamine-hydrolysing)
VKLLDGGQALHVDAGGRVSHANEIIWPDHQLTLAECAEDLRPLLIRAVRDRSRSAHRLTSDFSGGVDSTVLAFLAADARPAPLPIFTYFNPVAPVLDDLLHAERSAGLHAGFDHRLVAGTALSTPYHEIQARPWPYEPNLAVVAIARARTRFAAIAADGSDLHLTGEGGDAMLSAPPGYLADLAKAGERRALWQHCLAWARLRRRPVTRLLSRCLAVGGTDLATALRDLAQAMTDWAPGRDADTWENSIGYWPPPALSWLTKRAARSLADHVRERAESAFLSAEIGVGDYATVAQLRSSAAAQRFLRAVAAPLGVRLHAPYLDNAVARACLRLPARRRADPHIVKPLLRAALHGLAPDTVLARSTKGDYTQEQYVGLRRSGAALTSLVADSALADLGIVEPRRVLAALDQARAGMPVPWPALNQLIAVELWLRAAGGRETAQ